MIESDGAESESLSNIDDDNLFGSGPANWNAHSRASTENRTSESSNQVIFNHLNGGGMPFNVVPKTDNTAETPVRPSPAERARVGLPFTSGARPKVNNTERMGQQTNGAVRERTRNKMTKDRENRNKNSNTQDGSDPHLNGWFQNVKKNARTHTEQGFKPKLQPVNYESQIQRNGNSVKQKKQAINQNVIRGTPDDVICANDIDLDSEFLLLPNGLDPQTDPRSVSQIYSRPRYRRDREDHVLPPSSENLEIDPNNHSPIEDDDDQQAVGSTGTGVNRIHNNLWEGSKNCNVRDSARSAQPNTNFRIESAVNDIEADSNTLMPNADLPVPGFNRQAVGNSPNLRSEQIVQHFPGTNTPQVSQNHLNGHNSVQNLSLHGDSQITVPYDLLMNGEGLHSNLPTDFLFGEGKDSDFLIAQQLQMQFDREDADYQRQRQFDDISSLDYLRMSAEPHNSLPTISSNTRHGNSSSSNRLVDPERVRQLSNLYDESGDTLGEGFSDSLYVTTHNGEPSDIGMISPEELYDLPSQANPDPSLSPSNSHCLRGRSLEDENLARILTEEMRLEEDEMLARRLQEQDVRAMRQPNLGNRDDDMNEFRENSEPLYERYNRTWHRPLTVPTGGRNNLYNMFDSNNRVGSSTQRPLTQRSEFEFVENVHQMPPNRERYELLSDHAEDSLVSMFRDPRMLATLLMERSPGMMIPNEIDLNDYEALWELAEGLGEVRRVGMDPAAITALPVHIYQGPTGSDDNKTDCLVCLSEFQKGEELRTLPCCHIYHVDCINEWLKRNAICPVCRQPAAQSQ